MSEHPPIVIVGGGIGGLTLALALAAHGLRSHILEARKEFSKLGAGIQLGPNANRVLNELGLMEALKTRARTPIAVDIRNGRTNECLTTLPLIPNMQERFFAPYLTMRRVDLQSVLLTHVLANEHVNLTTGFKLEKARSEDPNGSVIVISDHGIEISGRALIGADGTWSQTRKILFPEPGLAFSGKTAWRALLKLNALPAGIPADAVGLWLGANAHLVHYPVGPGCGPERHLNIVAVIDDPTECNRWSQPADRADLVAHFQSWAEVPRQLIETARDWRKWSLFDAPPLASWRAGRICLLGDAAHPVLPFLAQGGALAIEDAFTMARCISENDDQMETAFRAYETERQPRCARVQSASRINGTIYHAGRPASLARDLVLKNTSPERLIKRYDWLYGYDVKTNSGL